jgi:hypothetical protein
MHFRLTEDRETVSTKFQGIALDYQATFAEFGMASKVGLTWRANFTHIDLDGTFQIWMTGAEARQLAARLLNAVDGTAIPKDVL